MNRSDSEPLRALVPSCEEIRDLMLLDALGETTPEQKATLATHLQSNPAHRGITVGEKKALTGRALHLYRVEAKK